jgi:NTE family protein
VPVTPHAIGKFLPPPRRERQGTALCLSGGGFRAALFHLGGLRRLNELGVLSRVDAISSVSGGSIMAAHLADRVRPWPEPGDRLDASEWNSRVAEPFYGLASRDLRTWPILKRLLPWNWLRTTTAVETLASLYERHLTRLRLPNLPDHPVFTLCATDMVFGVNWIFRKDQIGDYQAGYVRPAPDWPLARAVAASSCFPPIFNPMKPGLEPEHVRYGKATGPNRDDWIRGLRLTDGGIYDNMALEPVWKRAATVLVSDGGAPFDFRPDEGLRMRLFRYTHIQGLQSQTLRKRWLLASFSTGTLMGAYWGVGSCAQNYDKRFWGYSGDLADNVVSEVRTDMDGFSTAEIQVLENHGYALAEAAIQKHAPEFIAPDAEPFAVPHPEWQDERRVRDALRQSHRRVLRWWFRLWGA